MKNIQAKSLLDCRPTGSSLLGVSEFAINGARSRLGGDSTSFQPALWAFAGEVAIRDNVAVVVTEVLTITVLRAVGTTHVAIESTDLVGLIDISERCTHIFEFVVDVEGDFGQPDDHGQDSNGRDEDEFGRNDETSFVVDQLVEQVSHDSSSF
jgi:hypothetical protein